MMENILINIFMVLTLSPFMIFLVEVLCLWYCERRKHFYIRLLCGGGIYTVVSFLLLNWESPDYSFIFLLKIFLIFSISVAVMLLCYKITFKTALFALFTGYLFSNSHFYLTNIMLSLLNGGERGLAFYSLSFLFLVVYLGTFWLVLLRQLKNFELSTAISNFVIIFAALSFVIIHIISVTNTEAAPTGGLFINVYGALSSVSIILLLFSFCLRNKEEKEKEVIQTILDKTEVKDAVKEDVARTIELKAHDLKHQIGAIKTLAYKEEKDAALYEELNETERQIALYDGFIDSGNKAVDVAVSDRMDRIRSLDISFSYIIDGKQIDFIKSTDIYALLGNILDNAIEALEKEDNDNRVMTLNIYKKGDKVVIHSDNYCSHAVRFEDGLPVTTGDTKIHGYGTRSISFIVRKYGGKMEYSQTDSVFALDIRFRLTSLEQKTTSL